MPSRPVALPESLSDAPFDRTALEDARRSQGRVRRKDVVNPYHGVHSTSAPSTLLERCHAYAVRLRSGQWFSHVTANRLHAHPLPGRLELDLLLDIAVVRPASPPRTRGVEPHRLSRTPVVQEVEGLPIVAPTEAWVQIGHLLSLDEAIIIADHLLTVSPLDEEQTRLLMARRIAATRRPWNPMLLAALAEARCPVFSPGETRVRLLLVRAGIPEPELNQRIFTAAGVYLGKPDLLWRSARVGLEYDGAGHADEEQMRFDIERREAFHDAGWDTIHASADDLKSHARQSALIARVGKRLAARA